MLSYSNFAAELLIVEAFVRQRDRFVLIRNAAVGMISCAFLVAVALLVVIRGNGFPYKYMDLDDSGFVSPREALRTLDLGIRDTDVGTKKCIEVFALKDGLPIKQICSHDQ